MNKTFFYQFKPFAANTFFINLKTNANTASRHNSHTIWHVYNQWSSAWIQNISRYFDAIMKINFRLNRVIEDNVCAAQLYVCIDEYIGVSRVHGTNTKSIRQCERMPECIVPWYAPLRCTYVKYLANECRRQQLDIRHNRSEALSLTCDSFYLVAVIELSAKYCSLFLPRETLLPCVIMLISCNKTTSNMNGSRCRNQIV